MNSPGEQKSTGTTDPGFRTWQNSIAPVLLLDGRQDRSENVTFVSTESFARDVSETLHREQLQELLICGVDVSDEHLQATREIAHVLHHNSRPVRSTDCTDHEETNHAFSDRLRSRVRISFPLYP